ncbi:MAG: cobalamin biosynthesis protein CobT [Mesorhizobium sp.]|uniref:cobaltochelatase CobT-related protein n=1 Tax=unclassified Mesorhizobium TaxID=325217 RepID=UPI000F75DCF5|nr:MULTISPECIES: cobalamin biosynthesis protein CobT [unclassified Mesorhizobium]AZO47488.1 cobalamin biosynthesis protein CobT [Mesorhizobium sp. M4B.F.Ca.ET.058.02.1.1]RVC41658.1 cobalamin biosynthesis protein CobT [Mesorhizobium sp. M4A.F.Ca.ET.090.04.2.1]RVC79267.1 cobalamin biosynthesis protein CobT [Mesorhizobium sp. M4A.F.Ca.ET.022.05.2.1]RWC55992.1 MAG: cobalamin biosynthesis protein CobT [Mesorhizobium sp.]RWD01867.1 MAG: cobalamin biosynthesis protein CobT [Mesorhizobium sp.]
MLRGLGKHLKSLFVATPRGDTTTPGYHAYVTLHDWIVPSSKLSSAIGPLSGKHQSALDTAWAELENGLAGWRTKHLIQAADLAAEIRNGPSAPDLANTVVSILVDHSGSMRGQKMLYAAASVDIAQEFLRTLGIKVELLGFTTRAWRGGYSRQTWDADGRPKNPGRLNDLLHIVYREADDMRQGSIGHALKVMLRPDLLKENIDGEAIEWAADRLRKRPERRKILLVVSDGAPVDDSTLHANGPRYLQDHLFQVAVQLETAGDVELLAVGFGSYVDNSYRVSTNCEAPDELGRTMLMALQRQLVAGGTMSAGDTADEVGSSPSPN